MPLAAPPPSHNPASGSHPLLSAVPTPPQPQAPDVLSLQCMQVVGGHTAQAASFRVSGMAIQARCQPLVTSDVAASGGDLFFVSACVQHKIGRVFLADVAGHGEPVASTAAILHRWMQRYLNHTDQTAFVSRLNRLFARGPILSAPLQPITHAAPFATALALSFYEPTGTISFVRCGHPPLLLYSAKRGTWRVMTEDIEPGVGQVINLPLGILPDTLYQAIELKAEPGDAILMYTDALIEQPDPQASHGPHHQGVANKQLGVDGLVSHLNRIWQAARDQGLDPRTDAAAGQWLLSALIHPQRLDHTLQDDATAILVAISPEHGPRPTWMQKLKAAATVARDTLIWPLTRKAPALPPISEPKAARTGVRF